MVYKRPRCDTEHSDAEPTPDAFGLDDARTLTVPHLTDPVYNRLAGDSVPLKRKAVEIESDGDHEPEDEFNDDDDEDEDDNAVLARLTSPPKADTAKLSTKILERTKTILEELDSCMPEDRHEFATLQCIQLVRTGLMNLAGQESELSILMAEGFDDVDNALENVLPRKIEAKSQEVRVGMERRFKKLEGMVTARLDHLGQGLQSVIDALNRMAARTSQAPNIHVECNQGSIVNVKR